MSVPSSPLGIATAVLTGGTSLIPGNPLYDASGELLKGNIGKAAGKAITGPLSLSPIGGYLKAQTDAPPALGSPTASPTTVMASPASTIRARRNFSTLLTGSQGDTSQANVSKSTLLGGGNYSLGR